MLVRPHRRGAPRLLPLGALAAGFGLLGLDAQAQEPLAAPNAAVATSDGAVAASEATTAGVTLQTVLTEKLLEDRRTDTVKEALRYTGASPSRRPRVARRTSGCAAFRSRRAATSTSTACAIRRSTTATSSTSIASSCCAAPPTPLTRGTNNKVQDLTATYLQSDYATTAGWWGRRHELLAGVDIAREEFDNDSLVLPSGVTLDKNTPRPTLGNPDDGTRVDESLRQKVLNRNFAARALGAYGQDMEVAPHWKLLGGLRWDRFSGDYTSPKTTAADGTVTPQTERSRTDSLWNQRFGVLWQPDDRTTYYASYGTSFNTSGELYNYDAPGVKAPPEKSRNIEAGARLDLFEGWPPRAARSSTRPSITSATAIRRPVSRSRTTCCRADARRPASRSTSPGASRASGRRSSPMPGSRAPASTRLRPTARSPASRSATAPPSRRATAARSSDLQLTSEVRLCAGLNARIWQTPNRNPAGIVAPGFTTVDLLAECAVTPAVMFKLNVVNVADGLVADSLYTAHYIPGQARTVYLTLTVRF